MASLTFIELYTDGQRQADQLTGNGAANAKTIIKAGINEFYSDLAAARDWKTLENSTTIATVSGTNEYTPITSSATTPRIRRIESVVDQTSKKYLNEVKREIFEKEYPYVNTSTDTGSPTVWYQSGFTSNRDVKLKVYLVPNSVRTLGVIFYEEPLALSGDTDVPRIPDQYHWGLVYGGLAKYYEYEKDPVATYYRGMMEDFKRKILDAEYGESDEMPEMTPQGNQQGFVIGKIGRIYN